MSKSEHPPSWRERLREAVDRTGKKHAAIAWEAGIRPETLSRILIGFSPQPGLLVVARIAHACGETVGWILGEYGFSISEDERKKLRDAAATIIEVTAAGRHLRKDAPTRKVRRTRP